MQGLFLKETGANVKDRLLLIVMEYHNAIHYCMMAHGFESLLFSFQAKNSFLFYETLFLKN